MHLRHATPVILSAMLAVGCASTPDPVEPKSPQVDEALEEAKTKLSTCLGGGTYEVLLGSCNWYTLKKLSPESQAKAAEKWEAFIAEKGPDFRLLSAVELRDVEEAKRAIKEGANVDRRFEVRDNKTALILAAQKKNLELLTVLLDAGANPNIRQQGMAEGTTYVQDALNSKQMQDGKWVYGADIVKLLASYGYTPTNAELTAMELLVERFRDSTRYAEMFDRMQAALSQFEQGDEKRTAESEFGFHKKLTTEELLNKQSHANGMTEWQLGMELNMRCLASMAAFRNTLDPISDAVMINNINQDIGTVILMSAVNYDRLQNNGSLSRNNWNSTELLNMFSPLADELMAPYLVHYEKLLQEADRSESVAARYKKDIDTCDAVASGYRRALAHDR